MNQPANKDYDLAVGVLRQIVGGVSPNDMTDQQWGEFFGTLTGERIDELTAYVNKLIELVEGK